MPRVVVADAKGNKPGPGGRGVTVSIQPAAGVDGVVAPGLLMSNGVLHPVGSPELCGYALERLPHTTFYPTEEFGRVVSQVLPPLRAKMKVEVLSKLLPETDRSLTPRLAIESVFVGNGLSVLANVVYGAPAVARVDGTKLVHLGGNLPVRDPGAEVRLAHQLRESLNLRPGVRTTFEGVDAARFSEQVREFAARVGDVSLSGQVSNEGQKRRSPSDLFCPLARRAATPLRRPFLRWVAAG